MLNVFSWIAALRQVSSVWTQKKIIKLVMFYYQYCSDFVWKWSKCDVKEGSCLVVPASSQHCDLQVVHCESLKILQRLLLLVSSSKSVWEASFEKCLWGLFPRLTSFPTTQLQLMFMGKRQGLNNVGKEGTSWSLALCHTEKLQQCIEDNRLSYHSNSFVCSAEL